MGLKVRNVYSTIMKKVAKQSSELRSLSDYTNELTESIKKVDSKSVYALTMSLQDKMFDMNEVHVIGNGGSSANAHHIVGDYIKTFALYSTNLKINCLSDNSCYLTAASNDLDFSEVYELLVGSRITKGDLVIMLSGSGNSMNLVKAARAAKREGIRVASITGYDGGVLAEISDISINVPVSDWRWQKIRK